jgi:hypothetical protein
MKRIAYIVFFLVVGSLPIVARQSSFQDSLVDRMVGRWVLDGMIDGGHTTHDIVAGWVLSHQYLQIHEVSREKDSTGRPAYEAIVYIGWDQPSQGYACLWLDVTGGGGLSAQAIGHAERKGDDRIPFLFKVSDGNIFHTTFTYNRSDDSWQWSMDAEFGGKLEPFARVTLTRQPVGTVSFPEDPSVLVPQGENAYVILQPGYELRLEGVDGKKHVELVITVLNETEVVDGVETRVVEERESSDGQLVEVSRNFLAISTRTNSVYYFGEDVDMYRNGKIAGHEGAWRSGVNGARYGLLMPGLPLPGSRYSQENAPGIAMDRSEILGTGDTLVTRAGTFAQCLSIKETTPLEPGSTELKRYAKNIGLIEDGRLTLVRYGFVRK